MKLLFLHTSRDYCPLLDENRVSRNLITCIFILIAVRIVKNAWRSKTEKSGAKTLNAKERRYEANERERAPGTPRRYLQQSGLRGSVPWPLPLLLVIAKLRARSSGAPRVFSVVARSALVGGLFFADYALWPESARSAQKVRQYESVRG